MRILPGISSVSYLASCIGESYQDAAVYSIHGKKLCNLARRIRRSPKTFLLTSGVDDINWLGKTLIESGMPECEIIAGYQLSYGGQRIDKYTPEECCELKEEGLYTCFIKNPYADGRKLTHGMADEAFIRDSVPMTKEEVRKSVFANCIYRKMPSFMISAAAPVLLRWKSRLFPMMCRCMRWNEKEAALLIEKNKEKFGLQNITVVEAEAPEGLAGLPVATHAFIGGSGGRLKEILAALKQINPKMRIVINAVSMETICEIKEVLSMHQIEGEEIVQLQVSRAKKWGIII